jgi:hypothetical protein
MILMPGSVEVVATTDGQLLVGIGEPALFKILLIIIVNDWPTFGREVFVV